MCFRCACVLAALSSPSCRRWCSSAGFSSKCLFSFSLLRSSCLSSRVLASRIATLVTALECSLVSDSSRKYHWDGPYRRASFIRYLKGSTWFMSNTYGLTSLPFLFCCLMILAKTFSSCSAVSTLVGMCFR